MFDEQRSKFLFDVLQPKRRTRICDIGASPINEPPYKGFFDAGLCDVIGFEPSLQPFEELQKHKTDRETYIQAALGDGKKHTLNICKSPGFTSLFDPNDEFFDYIGMWKRVFKIIDRVRMKTRKLDDLDIPDFDLLKIDVQGAEAMIFENGKTKLSKSMAVISEVAFAPLYVDQPLLDRQMAVLQNLGFSFHKQLTLKRVALRSSRLANVTLRRRVLQDQAVDGDVVFLRRPMTLAGFSDEELEHMALLADSVFFSISLVLKILELFETRSVISGVEIDKYVDLVNAQEMP